MSTNQLFQEAIADAKKLKEVAEENAKKAILEAVTPRIREFIDKQLLESDEEHGTIDDEDFESDEDLSELGIDPDDEELVELDESAMKMLISMLGGSEMLNEMSHSNLNEFMTESVSSALSSFNSKQKQKIRKIIKKINNTKNNLETTRINNKENNLKENRYMSNNKYYEVDLQSLREALEDEVVGENLYEEEWDEESDLYEDDSEEDDDLSEMSDDLYEEDVEDEDDLSEMFDLFEEDEEDEIHEEDEIYEEDEDISDLINEIKLELDLGDEIEAEDLPEELRGMLIDDEEEDEEVEFDEDEEEDDEEEEEFELPEPDEEEENEEYEVDAEMLKEELVRIRRMMREGSMDHHFGGKGTSKAGIKNSFGGSGKKNAGYKGSFGGGSYGADPFTNPPQLNKLNEALNKQRRINRSLAEKLNKYRGAVQTLREQLEDLNLFNAKLLYVNKLLQNKTLSESKKKSIIKALDEARTLREAKSLYNSLTETLGSKRKSGTLTESRRLGSSSRTTTSSSSRQAGELDRWQTLAGLK